MEIRFLGTSSCIPEPEREAASFVINGKHLVDTGWVQPRRFQKTLSPVSVSAAG
jgi:ribonuclease BN (tRNA processing enzyme)